MRPGHLLGPYEIIASLGAGGMGEVYRGRDTRLAREVAIKVLPAEFAADPDRVRRFEQEARAVAALNHPNILAIHDVGTHEGSPYLVAELLEGESLRERLRGGALPPRKVIEFAVQVCAGLAAAHEKGIVHRDLKPENLFVTSDGHVKVLDFGVAKLLKPVQAEPAVAPTLDTAAETTAPGVVIGTVAYMSPEQVRGLPVDHRSDVFSIGCVLYEMLTGRSAFARDTAADTMSAILKEDPAEIGVVGPGVPAPLAHVVSHCLEKRPEERFQSARDLSFALASTSGVVAAAVPATPSEPPTRLRRWLGVVVGGLLLIALGAIGALVAVSRTRRPTAEDLVRFAATTPEGGTLLNDVSAVAISPDGRRLVYTVMDAAGTIRLWVRPLDSLTAQPLAGTEGATLPFWSPDSRFVAFFAQGKLRKVPVAGGSPEVICDATPDGRGGSWSKDDVIVFAPHTMGRLLKVSAEGGEPVEVATPDRKRGETGLRFPCFLPDGRHFLYVSLPRKQSGFDVYVGTLDSKDRRFVTSALSAPVFAEPGYLLFALGDRLVAQRFDRSSLRPVGEVVPLGDAPAPPAFDGAAVVSASANGVLSHPASSPPMTELVWLDRTGRQTGRIPLPTGSYSNPSLSPNGRWAAVTKFNSPTSYDLWLVDLQRSVSVTTRLTFDGLVAAGWGPSWPVIWSPDSTRIAYSRARSGVYDVYEVQASGTGRPEPLVQSDAVFKLPAAWSPDGKFLLFTQLEEGQWDLWLLPLQGDRTPVPYLRTPFNEDAAAFSPDGRWLAYDSDETGTPEIYVRSFLEPREKYRVSTSGGAIAHWSGDGKELLFFALSRYFFGSGPIFAVDVEATPTFKAGAPRLLFIPLLDNSGLAATADLSRFLATVPVAGATPASITITLNWQAALER